MGTPRSIFCLVVLCCLGTAVQSQNDLEQSFNKLSKANAFFANLLYKQVSKDSANFIFSPLSISVALSMLNVGAVGTTFQELNRTLGFQFANLNEQELLQGYQNVMTRMRETQEGYQFNLANALFLQNSFPFYPNYTSSITQNFQSLIRPVDFSNTQATLNQINDWVSTETNGKITSIFQDVKAIDVMVLANAVFFKGQWLHQFDETETTDVDFFTTDGTRKSVNMMSAFLSAKHNARHAIGGAVLEIPYKGNTFSIFFVLPEIGTSLTELEGNLTSEVLMQLSSDLQTTNLTIGVPKFSLQSNMDIIPHLSAIGIRNIFSDSADLSRISSLDLKVTQAVHKATIQWTEEGAEASAATGVISSKIMSATPYFWLNRPFMFILRHNPTGIICFMGKVSDV